MHKAFTISAPALLFSALTLILLAFTNRFVAYTDVVRDLHKLHIENLGKALKGQIDNLCKQLYLILTMHIWRVTSLFFCAIHMFRIFKGQQLIGAYILGAALFLFCATLAISIYEIQISVKALELHLSNMEK